MKETLLAINGIHPREGIFRYAVQFSRRMQTGLVILQVLAPRKVRGLVRELGRRLDRAHRSFENTMAAAAFSESGEHVAARDVLEEGRKTLERFISFSDQAEVPCRIQQAVGIPDVEISEYILLNGKIVVVIYDGYLRQGKLCRNRENHILLRRRVIQRLGIPVVIPSPCT